MGSHLTFAKPHPSNPIQSNERTMTGRGPGYPGPGYPGPGYPGRGPGYPAQLVTAPDPDLQSEQYTSAISQKTRGSVHAKRTSVQSLRDHLCNHVKDLCQKEQQQVLQTCDALVERLTCGSGGLLAVVVHKSLRETLSCTLADGGYFLNLIRDQAGNIHGHDAGRKLDILLDAFSSASQGDRWSLQELEKLASSVGAEVASQVTRTAVSSLVGRCKDGAFVFSYAGTVISAASKLHYLAQRWELVGMNGFNFGCRHETAMAISEWLTSLSSIGVVFVRSSLGGLHVLLPSKDGLEAPPEVLLLDDDRLQHWTGQIALRSTTQTAPLRICDKSRERLYQGKDNILLLLQDGSVKGFSRDIAGVAATIKYWEGVPYIKAAAEGSTEVMLCLEDVSQQVPLCHGMVLRLADIKHGPTFQIAVCEGGAELQLVAKGGFIAEPDIFTTDFEVGRGKSKVTEGLQRCHVTNSYVSGQGNGAFCFNNGQWYLRWHPKWKEDTERIHGTFMILLPRRWYPLPRGAKKDGIITVWCRSDSREALFGIMSNGPALVINDDSGGDTTTAFLEEHAFRR